MPNREVNLTKRVLTQKGKRYCSVVLAANGRVKPDFVLVDGKPERHPEGAYYLEWYEGSKRKRLSVGKDAQEAAARRLTKEAERNAINHGVGVAASTSNNGHRRLLSTAISEWLAEIKLTKKRKTLSAYSNGLEYFAESCDKQYVEDVERRDLLAFAAYLRDEKELAPQTCHNRFRYVVSFLKWCNIRGLAQRNDWPQFVEAEPEIYEQEELDQLFKSCADDEERLHYEFFLMTGMREQEVMYCYWSDVNLKHSTVKVSYKPDRGWTPKAYKEREIPIPEKLVVALKAWKPKSNKNCSLVFPTSGCKPDTHFLERLKACAKRASLDPDNFRLHKFRATFATWALSRVDLRTVQLWLGHTDIESTMRYLKPSRSQQVRDKVNEIFAWGS
jgi:integrase/recombinase XerD